MGLRARQEIFKTTYEEKLVNFDFVNELDTGETISTATITFSPSSGISGTTPAISGTIVQTKVIGGTNGITYTVDCKIVTSTQKRETAGTLRLADIT